MSWAAKLNDKLEASKQKNLAGIREQEAKKAMHRAKADAIKSDMAVGKQELKDIGTEMKNSYRETRDGLNADIAANHGKSPTDDSMAVTTANLGIRIVKLFFAGIFLVAFIYILVSMIF